MRIKFYKKKVQLYEIAPDEIFLDAQNIPEFDTQQFEGRLEKSINKKTIFALGFFSLLFGILFAGRIGILEIKKGQAYLDRSEYNSLATTPLFADRGVVLDRNNKELISNILTSGEDTFPHRSYIDLPGFGHLLGYVSYPAKDSNGIYWQEKIIGKDGVEKQFNQELAGTNGLKILETDAFGNAQSENILDKPKNGDNLVLAVDADIQSVLYNAIKDFTAQTKFEGGAGVIMNVETGEIIAMTSFPEYDSNILSEGADREMINSYIHDPRKVFLNKVVSGLYTPGSIVKPFVAIGALSEGIISPEKQILSTGSIAIPNPYDPDLKTVFNDWKAHGWVDLRHALAVSSNVYFYEIGGGFQEQVGLGIDNLHKYESMFGMGKKTNINMPGETAGNIPNPVWKEKNFPGDPWRIGDTYNTAIGQYGVQVTPLQMVRGIAAIANYGRMITPTVLKTDDVQKGNPINISKDNFTIIHEAMRLTVTEGTGTILSTPAVMVAAKTGSAQVGIAKQFMNSWSVGFFPYEHPKYAFVVLVERGPKSNTTGASHVMRTVLDYISANKQAMLE
jgi:penicillin-binding protein 2